MQVLVAMSGGVDSSVAACLLRDAGHEVVGVTMKLWGGSSDSGCCSVSDVDDARRVAQQLGIEHQVFNFGEEFDTHVVDPYVAAHAAGRTPNPCVECNRHLKFDKLLRRARALGFDAVATGHHAQVATLADGTRRVARGADGTKDQSYVLYMLNDAQLAQVLLPVGSMTKSRVRALALDMGLRTATKPDSQDVCFITATGGRHGFLADRLAFSPATVVDEQGTELAQVDAVQLVTIGQRRGLNLPGGADPRYVLDVDVEAGQVVVGPPRRLYVDETELVELVWPTSAPVEPMAVAAQCSAHGAVHEATFDPARGVLRWHEPQRRVAPGQAVVFYRDDHVAGGGIAA